MRTTFLWIKAGSHQTFTSAFQYHVKFLSETRYVWMYISP